MKKEPNIELGGDTPDIQKLTDELTQAQTDASHYYEKLEHCRAWWESRWPGQTWDGRKHKEWQPEPFPHDKAADSRVRTIADLVDDHLTVMKFARRRAKVQAKPMRPAVQGREANKASRLLQWRVNVHMKAEMNRELSLAYNWKFAIGLAFVKVEWEQQRRVIYRDITVPDLADVLEEHGIPDAILFLMDALIDPAQEDALTSFIQEISPIVTRGQARGIVKDLREVRFAKIPISYPFVNKPRVLFRRPAIDILFPSETCDLQAGRFVADDEWLSETDLEGRITTDGYDPGFVEEAKKQKGKSGLMMMEIGRHRMPPRSYRDLINLTHVYYRASIENTPCVLHTVFNPLVIEPRSRKGMYAKHGPFEFDHQQYPYITFRRKFQDPKLLSSIGIAEEAYTEEMQIKTQLDSMIDRTGLVMKPLMIVPPGREREIRGQELPGSILGARANEIEWKPTPPIDATPAAIITMVDERLQNRYGLFGAKVDPEKKKARREEVAADGLEEYELLLEQILQIMQQFEVDAEVAQVVGGLERPFHVDLAEIQGRHEISASADVQVLTDDYIDKKYTVAAKIVQTFNQGGTAKTNQLQRALLELLDPDLADIGLEKDEQTATDRERKEERQAVANAFLGIVDELPMLGNHQLRLSEIQSIFQANPHLGQRLQQQPDTQEILKNRIQFFQRQIQQHTQNPGIGRALVTRPFAPKMAPQVSLTNGEQ